MKNRVKKEESEVQDLSSLTIKEVEKFLKRDITSAISCLNAIYSDPDLLQVIATFMHGRLQNAKHKEQLVKQSETNTNGIPSELIN